MPCFEPWIEEVGDDDEDSAEVEGRMQLLVLVEEDGPEENAPDGLEVHGEIGRVGGQPAKEVNVPGVSHGGAEQGEGEKRQPVAPGRDLEVMRRDEGENEGCHEACPGHLVEEHAAGRGSPGHQLPVEDGKDGVKQGSHQAHHEAESVVVAKVSSDKQNSCNDDSPAEQLTRADGSSFDEGFGEGREEGDGGKGSKGHGHVGEGDRPEKADPVSPLEESKSEDGQQPAAGETKEGRIDSRQPECHGKSRNEDAPENEGGRLDRDDASQHRGEGENENEEMILE